MEIFLANSGYLFSKKACNRCIHHRSILNTFLEVRTLKSQQIYDLAVAHRTNTEGQ